MRKFLRQHLTEPNTGMLAVDYPLFAIVIAGLSLVVWAAYITSLLVK